MLYRGQNEQTNARRNQVLNYLIKNAKIIDGSGKPYYLGNVGIKDGKIVLINKDEEAEKIIDADGRYVVPGFIDAHSHGDFILGSEDARVFKTNQGITTELAGHCGSSMAPVNPETITDLKNLLMTGTNWFSDDMHSWTTFEKYLQYAESQPKSANIRFFVGHNALRIAVMGMENRPATKKEIDMMKGMLREAMESGASGFSTGLIYTPSCYAEKEEVLELAKVIAPFGGIYSSHMRNESENVVESVEEVINVGRKAGVSVDISHHKILGKKNWGMQKETLRLIHEANAEGIRVFCDQYPYTRCMTTINTCMPPWHLDGGYDALCEKLKNSDFRKQLKSEMGDPSTPYDNFFLNAGGWDGVYVYCADETPEAEGLFISEYAKNIGKDEWTAFFDLCVANNCRVGGVFSSMCDEDVCEIIRDPYCVVGTDGVTRSLKEKGHPRAMATFPRAITYFVKEKGILTLEQTIHKMTGLTAEFMCVKNKGLIKDGYDADLVIFDYDGLSDEATYSDSNKVTEGIDHVIVNGEIVYKDKKFTGKYSGKVIRYNL